MLYLSAEEVIRIHREMVKIVWTEERGIVLRPDPPPSVVLAVNEHRLHAAIDSPKAGFGDLEFYPDEYSKAAVLARGIIAHCFGDGNKRTGMMAAAVFLLVNGILLELEMQQFVDVALWIDREKPSIGRIAEVFREHSRLVAVQLSLPF